MTDILVSHVYRETRIFKKVTKSCSRHSIQKGSLSLPFTVFKIKDILNPNAMLLSTDQAYLEVVIAISNRSVRLSTRARPANVADPTRMS